MSVSFHHNQSRQKCSILLYKARKQHNLKIGKTFPQKKSRIISALAFSFCRSEQPKAKRGETLVVYNTLCQEMLSKFHKI